MLLWPKGIEPGKEDRRRSRRGAWALGRAGLWRPWQELGPFLSAVGPAASWGVLWPDVPWGGGC